MNTNSNIKLKILDKNEINTTKRKIPDNNNTNDNTAKNNKLEDQNKSLEKPQNKQVNTSRCMSCNRKIGLTGFQCKCKNYFCTEHRYSDRHDCTFDYKQFGKELLSKTNPSVIPSKIDSI